MTLTATPSFTSSSKRWDVGTHMCHCHTFVLGLHAVKNSFLVSVSPSANPDAFYLTVVGPQLCMPCCCGCLRSPELASMHTALHLRRLGSCNAEHLCVKLATWAASSVIKGLFCVTSVFLYHTLAYNNYGACTGLG